MHRYCLPGRNILYGDRRIHSGGGAAYAGCRVHLREWTARSPAGGCATGGLSDSGRWLFAGLFPMTPHHRRSPVLPAPQAGPSCPLGRHFSRQGNFPQGEAKKRRPKVCTIPVGNAAASSRTAYRLERHSARIPSLLLTAKSPACCVCSLAGALKTPPRRYQLFAGVRGENLCNPRRERCPQRSESGADGEKRPLLSAEPPSATHSRAGTPHVKGGNWI